MSGLRFETVNMQIASLGLENPFPPINIVRNAPAIKCSEHIPREIIDGLDSGQLNSILPYPLQDGYSRKLEARDLKVAILENEILKAVILLEYGGRLWSLHHKPSNRELLDTGRTIYLANLAIRNAWFCGGVEWNIGTIGHSPFTCSPLFASQLEQDDGSPFLRMYEYERFRRTPFQIDIFLPDGSPVLLVRNRIINPNDYEVPVYWWTNIAIPERAGSRVIVRAEKAYCLGIRPGWLDNISFPITHQCDFSYSQNIQQAADIFFHIPQSAYPWIAVVDTKGYGFVHLSSSELIGRKVWAWGKGKGGENWQRFLSPDRGGYIEVQAGLTRTQLEHFRLPAGDQLVWLEAFGMIQVDPQEAHAKDWKRAQKSVGYAIEELAPSSFLEQFARDTGNTLDQLPKKIVQRGAGWGALENLRRDSRGQAHMNPPGLVFDEKSLGQPQFPWVQFLESGVLLSPEMEPALPGFIVDEEWQEEIESSFSVDLGENWFSLFHLGIMCFYRGDKNGAKEAWEKSLEHHLSPYSLRNLALLFWAQGQLDEAGELLIIVCSIFPNYVPVVVECGRCLIEGGQTKRFLKILSMYPQEIRSHGRVRLLEAQASLIENDLLTVKRFFDEGVVVDDLREGETSISDLWFSYQTRRLSIEEKRPLDAELWQRANQEYPLPEAVDYRMSII